MRTANRSVAEPGNGPPFNILWADAEAEARGSLLLQSGKQLSVDALSDPGQVLQRVQRAQAGGKPYDLVIVNLVGMNGASGGTLQQLRMAAPASAVLALADPGSSEASAANSRGVRVLPLPFDPGEMDRVVGELAARKSARSVAAEGELVRQIASTARQILAAPTLEAGLRALFGRLATTLSAESFMVALYDRRSNTLQFPLVYNHGEYLKPGSRPFTPGGLAEWVITNNRPIISGNLAADAARNGWQLPAGVTPAKSAIMLPLVLSGGVFGVMAAQSSTPAAFPADAVAVFTAAADTAGAAISTWKSRHQREWEEALLADLDEQLAGATNRETVLRLGAAAAAELTAADGAAAVPVGKSATSRSLATYQTTTPGRRQSPAFSAWMADLGKDGGPSRSMGSGGSVSIISQPLRGVRSQPDTLLMVASAAPRPFDEHDQMLLSTVSRRAADALTRVELYDMRDQERTIIRRIARRCAVERDIMLLLSSSLNEIRKLAQWDTASVWHYDPANAGLRPLRLEGRQSDLDYGTLIPYGQGPAGIAAQSGKVQRVALGVGGPIIAVPLWGRDRRPGVLMLGRVRGAAPFGDDDEKLLGVIGELIAAGIDKSWWHEAAELARKLGTLLTTPGQDTWAAALGAIRDCMPEGACALLIAESGRAGLRVLSALGSPQLTANTAWLEDTSGPLAGLAAGKALLVEDAGKGTGESFTHGAGSLVAAPFTSGGEVFGALVAWSPRPRRMGERELQLVRRGAEHIAVALFASRESQRADDASHLLAMLRDVGGGTDFGTDVSTVLRRVLDNAMQHTPATGGAVLLREADMLVQRVQLPANNKAAGKMLRVPLGQGTVGQVAQSGKLRYLPNVGQTAGVGGEHGSLVAVPVVSAGETIGVITVSNPKSDAFSERDIEMLRSLATQAATLLDGSNRQDALHQLRRLPRMNVSPAKLLAQAPVLVAETLHVPAATVHVFDRSTNTYVLAGAVGIDAATRSGAMREIPGELPSVKELFKNEKPLGVTASDAYAQASYWHAAESRAAGFNSVMAAPISLGSLPYSIITAYAPAGRNFTQSESGALATLCEQLGQTLQVLHQEYRYGTLASRGADSAPLLDPDEEFQARALHGEPGPALEALVGNAVALSDARCGYILLRNSAENRYEPRVIVGGIAPDSLRWPLDGEGREQRAEGRETGVTSIESGIGTASALSPLPSALSHTADPVSLSQILAPIEVVGADGRREVLGLLGIESPAENAFGEDDSRLLRTLASDAAMLLANAGLYARSRGQEQQLAGMMDAMRTMLADLNMGNLQERVAAAARQALAADLAIVYRHGAGATATAPTQDGALDPESLVGDVVSHATARQVIADAPTRGAVPYFVENMTDDDPASLPVREGIRSMAIVPLLGERGAVGVLYIGYRRPIRFGPAARRYIASFGEVAALAFKNGVAHRSLEDAMGQQMQSLSLASHELKEPVDTAKMIVETALNELWQPIGEQLRERLGAVYSLLDSHYSVLAQILQLGKLTAGAQKLAQEPVQIDALLYDIVGTFLNIANTEGIELSANLDPLLSSLPTSGDSGLLKTAISNLVQNALKFTAAGGKVVVTAVISRDSNPAGDLVILVDDNGIGIPADKLDSIFSPYVQVDQTLSRDHGGIGLGLSLARTIIEQHGGTITAESELGGGSRFTIRLPLDAAVSD